MGKYAEREFRVGDYWLSKQARSPAWCRTWYDQQAKQTKRKSLGTSDFQEAQQKLTQWFIDSQRPVQADADEILLGEILIRYWNDHAEHVASAKTIKTHLRYWADYGADKTLDDGLAFSEIERFKNSLLKKGLAASSVNHVLAIGKAAIRHAWMRGEIKAVPPIAMLKVGKQEPMGRPLSPLEAANLYNLSPPHIKLLIWLLIGTGGRPSSMFDLTWEQIDFEHGLIDLNPHNREQNKKHRPVVRLVPSLAERLQGGKGYVLTYKGERINSVKTSWRKVRAGAGLGKDVTLYSFRHTIGRWLRKEGVPMEQISGQLGHSLGGVTERYAEYSPNYLLEAEQAIERFFEEMRVSLV